MDNVVFVRWCYSPDAEFSKARIECADDAKVLGLIERCAAEFGAPIDAAESARRDTAFAVIMEARRTGSRRFALPPS